MSDANQKRETAPNPSASRPDIQGYGLLAAEAGAGLLPWNWLTERMERARNYWVVTVGRDSRPHAVPVWGVWYEGAFYFGTSLDSRKSRNLNQNSNAAVHLESGDEVVILEGTARPEATDEVIEKLDDRYQAKYGVPLMGNPVIRLDPEKAFGWLESEFPGTATRWQL